VIYSAIKPHRAPSASYLNLHNEHNQTARVYKLDLSKFQAVKTTAIGAFVSLKRLLAMADESVPDF